MPDLAMTETPVEVGTIKACVVALRGELDAFVAESVREKLNAVIDSGIGHLILDLREVSYLGKGLSRLRQGPHLTDGHEGSRGETETVLLVFVHSRQLYGCSRAEVCQPVKERFGFSVRESLLGGGSQPPADIAQGALDRGRVSRESGQEEGSVWVHAAPRG